MMLLKPLKSPVRHTSFLLTRQALAFPLCFVFRRMHNIRATCMTRLPTRPEPVNIAEVAVLKSICQHGNAQHRLHIAQHPVSRENCTIFRNQNQNIRVMLQLCKHANLLVDTSFFSSACVHLKKQDSLFLPAGHNDRWTCVCRNLLSGRMDCT